MKQFKFVGGPWDGEYHETDGRDHIRIPHLVPTKLIPPSLETAKDVTRVYHVHQ